MHEWMIMQQLHTSSQTWGSKVQRFSMESKGKAHPKVCTNGSITPVRQGSKSSQSLHSSFGYYQRLDYSIISNILKRNSSEHSIAWQLLPNYSVIVSALHLKGPRWVRVLRFSASLAPRSKIIMSSRLLGKQILHSKGPSTEWGISCLLLRDYSLKVNMTISPVLFLSVT